MISFRIKADSLKEARLKTAQLRSEFNTQLEIKFRQWLEQYLLERIRVNTPILTGALRESLQVEDVVARAQTLKASIVSRLSYALKIHEDEYNLGPRSAEQPSTPEGGVGNKYISRVVRYHVGSLKSAMGAVPRVAVRKIYASGQVRAIRSESL